MNVNLDVDISALQQILKQDLPRMAPYVMATALTAAAKRAQQDVKDRLPQVFDGVTPFTYGGVRIRPATKENLITEVYFAESRKDRGQPAREYIRPGAEGSPARSQRRHEYQLTQAGILPPGWVTVPGRGAKLDGYGNIPGSIYKQILSVLRLSSAARQNASAKSIVRAVTASARRAKKLGVEAEYFVAAPGNRLGKNGGWLPPGVWKHLPNRRITQILKFVRKARYERRLDMPQTVRDSFNRYFPDEFDKAFHVVRARFAAAALRR